LKPEEFLGIIQPKKNDKPAFRIGKIPATYTSGRPMVQFDGESTISTRIYPYLGSYTPAANDRVLIATVGHGWVILGKII
jgi:hypothetical protein